MQNKCGKHDKRKINMPLYSDGWMPLSIYMYMSWLFTDLSWFVWVETAIWYGVMEIMAHCWFCKAHCVIWDWHLNHTVTWNLFHVVCVLYTKQFASIFFRYTYNRNMISGSHCYNNILFLQYTYNHFSIENITFCNLLTKENIRLSASR